MSFGGECVEVLLQLPYRKGSVIIESFETPNAAAGLKSIDVFHSIAGAIME